MRSIPKTTNSGIYPCTYTLNHHHLGMNDLCAGLSSLLCLCAADLLGGGSLDGLAGLADGGGAGNGVLAEVGAVVALGGRVDDGGVDPVTKSLVLSSYLSLQLGVLAVYGRFDVLARALGGAEVGGLGGGSGLVVLVGLLDEEGDAAVLRGDDTDGLA